jgi:hypothetical protein
VFYVGSVPRLYHGDQRDVLSLQLAAGKQPLRRSSQTFAPGRGVGGGGAPIVVSRCVPAPSRILSITVAEAIVVVGVFIVDFDYVSLGYVLLG